MPTPGSDEQIALRLLEHSSGSTAGPAEKLKIRVVVVMTQPPLRKLQLDDLQIEDVAVVRP